jgi:hypothetical protein
MQRRRICGMSHEMALRSAFQTLLAETGGFHGNAGFPNEVGLVSGEDRTPR